MKIDYKNINKTKIVATIGQITAKEDVMLALAKAGLSVVRINMSHGELDYFSQVAKLVHKINSDPENEFNIAIMTDTKGPEIRVGSLAKPLVVKQDSLVTIYTKNFKTPTKDNAFFVYDSTKKYNMAKDLKVGNKILVDDGKLQLVTKTVDANKGVITAFALNTHTLLQNKRINLPDSHYSMPFLSERDKTNLLDTIKIGADAIALSFVNRVEDIEAVRTFLNKAKKDNGIQLFAKIETQQALDNIKAIIKASDGIMIARGDLALETPFYNIPTHEVEIIELCKKANKPVIVATQMLDSLEKNLQPTRAEVTDVYFACLNGTDATMLSGETAGGLYPVQALTTMATINKASEKCFDFNKHFKNVFLTSKFSVAIKKQVADIKLEITSKKSKAFAITTDNEQLIKAISAARLPALAVVTTSKQNLVSKFAYYYGIKMHFEAKPAKTKCIVCL